MARWPCLVLPCLAALLWAISGCSEPPVGVAHTHHPDAEVTICGLCGDVKGSEKCCKEGTAICQNCLLQKGSVLCCNPAMSGRRDVILCRICGEKAFTKKCCLNGNTNVALCPKCGLHKGSPGCCKIEPVAKDAVGQGDEHAHKGGHS